MARTLTINIVGDASSYEKALRKAAGDTKKFTGQLEKTRSHQVTLRGFAKSALAAGAGFAVAQKSIDLATSAVRTGIGEWNEQQQVAAQTRQVLKTMGAQAGVTAKQVSGLATSIMKKTGIDDEQVQAGENLLLTFRKIHNQAGKNNDIFDQATKVMTDFSVRFGKDIPSSAVMVGKALNDPIKGLTSLSRVGVQFTKGQKDQIKSLVESGHTMQAQKIILKELKAETGGAAEAAGKTLAGQINIARQTFNNWMGDLVGKTIPIIQRTISWLRDHWPEISAAIKNFWQSVKPTLVAVGQLIAAVAKLFQRHWGQISQTVKAFAGVFKAQMKLVADVIRLFADLIRGDWGKAWQDFKRIPIDVIKVLIAQFKAYGTLLKNVVVGVAKGLGHLFADVFKAPINAIIDVLNKIKIPSFKIKLPGPVPDIKFGGIDPFPNIPRLADGGIAIRRTLAMIGERGPEAIVPLRGAPGLAGITINGGLHLHGVQNVGQLENELVKRSSSRSHNRRGAR